MARFVGWVALPSLCLFLAASASRATTPECCDEIDYADDLPALPGEQVEFDIVRAPAFGSLAINILPPGIIALSGRVDPAVVFPPTLVSSVL